MPTRSSAGKDHDFTTVAERVVEQAIGEQWDGSPLTDKDKGKNPAAVALGRLGGAKGGACGGAQSA
jgi:glutamine synthetase adenylyltransferase